jgi:hypothetical protein
MLCFDGIILLHQWGFLAFFHLRLAHVVPVLNLCANFDFSLTPEIKR